MYEVAVNENNHLHNVNGCFTTQNWSCMHLYFCLTRFLAENSKLIKIAPPYKQVFKYLQCLVYGFVQVHSKPQWFWSEKDKTCFEFSCLKQKRKKEHQDFLLWTKLGQNSVTSSDFHLLFGSLNVPVCQDRLSKKLFEVHAIQANTQGRFTGWNWISLVWFTKYCSNILWKYADHLALHFRIFYQPSWKKCHPSSQA